MTAPANWWIGPDLDELPVAPLPTPPATPPTPAPILWMRPSPRYDTPEQPEHSAAFRAVVTAFAFVATLAIAPGIAQWAAERIHP